MPTRALTLTLDFRDPDPSIDPDRTQPMTGTEVEVLCDSRPNRGTNIVGLPSPDGSQGGVWYFPVTALEKPEGSTEIPAAKHEYLWQLSRQAEVEVAHGLGQIILHRKHGYRGVVVGHDPSCLQSEAWCAQMGVDTLPRGRLQPFYHILVDRRDREGGQITYVAEENVALPPTDGAFAVEPVQHPMVPELLRPASFDAERGEYEPNDELRALYPQRMQGCWMVDAVKPDRGAAETEEEC